MTGPASDLAAVADPVSLSVAEASRAIASGELSPEALLEAIFARIDAIDGTIHSYLSQDREGARADAAAAGRRARQGCRVGPLDGIPFAVKDNIYTANLTTTAASRVPSRHDPSLQATLVTRLQQAGAVLVGKLNTWEYGTGTGAVHFDLDAPPARNPWNPGYFTGGSSSGAGAAVAGGTAMFAVGTDTGGSVRLPAAACGVVGFKPTHGRISRHGVMPNCPSFDTPGPLALTVEDAALAYLAMSGHDALDAATLACDADDVLGTLRAGVAGLRVGVVRALGPQAPVQPAIAEAIERTCEVLRGQGAQVRDVELPLAPVEYRAVAAPVNRAESFKIHARDFHEHADKMGRALREKLEVGMRMEAAEYQAALRARRKLVAETDAVFDGVDVLLLPMTDRVAPALSDTEAVIRFTTASAGSLFSLTGNPALSLPAGFDPQGLPVAVQLAAGFLQEAMLLRVAHALEGHVSPRPARARPG